MSRAVLFAADAPDHNSPYDGCDTTVKQLKLTGKKEKTTPSGVNSLRRQVLFRAAQVAHRYSMWQALWLRHMLNVHATVHCIAQQRGSQFHTSGDTFGNTFGDTFEDKFCT